MSIDIPVGKTALYTCAERSFESKNNNRLFEDVLAEKLAGEEGYKLLSIFHNTNNNKRQIPISLSVILRTLYFDEIVEWSIKYQDIKQIVIIAAGMDTRFSRINHDIVKNTKLWELDFPQVMNYKKTILDNIKNGDSTHFLSYTRVGVDLTTTTWIDSLKQYEYNNNEKTLWIIEGLFVYLTNNDIKQIINIISTNTINGSIITGDWMNKSYLSCNLTKGFRDVFSSFNSPFINGINHDNFIKLLQEENHFISKLYSLGDYGIKYPSRVPLNMIKIANLYPISNSNYQMIPRHFLFIGEKNDTNITSNVFSDNFIINTNPIEEINTSNNNIISNNSSNILYIIQDLLDLEYIPKETDSLIELGFDSLLFIILGNKLNELKNINNENQHRYLENIFLCEKVQDIIQLYEK